MNYSRNIAILHSYGKVILMKNRRKILWKAFKKEGKVAIRRGWVNSD